jgi:phage terminase small subunit
MPILTNQRHERFAQGIAGGKSPTRAWVEAGYSKKGACQSAKRALNYPDLQARVRELQETIAHVAVVSRAKVLERLMQLSQKAEDRRQFMAAIRAEELIGRAISIFDAPEQQAEKPTGITYRWAQPTEFTKDAPKEQPAPAEAEIPKEQVQ